MTRTLRGRIATWAITLGVLVLAGGAMVAVQLRPALARAERALVPFEAILPALAERHAGLSEGIVRLNARLALPDPEGLAFADWRPSDAPSLVAIHADALTPEAARVLAEIEGQLTRLEADLAGAHAVLDAGRAAQAAALLEDVRRRESALVARQRAQVVFAVEAGAEARRELGTALATAARVGGAVLVLLLVAAALLVWDLRRHVLAPLEALEAGVDRLARGDWTRTVPEAGDAELRRLARHFNAMVDILRRRAGRQAQFATAGELLSGATHELNNPLQAIRGIAELRQADDPDWAQVLTAAERASRLVRDLGRFVRTARPVSGVHDVHDLVHSALDLIRFQFVADGIDVQLELSERLPPVLCDEHDMVQALVHLLGNTYVAMRGAPPPRRVTVTTWREGDMAVLRIRDNGPGIPADVRGQIFDPFFTTKSDGVGLGLSTARDIIQGEGGQIALDDTTGGASFTIRLPAAPGLAPPDQAAAPAPVPDSSLDGRTVLVVDDEVAVRDVLRRFLEHEGARVVLAAGGREALDRAADHQIDAVVLDLRMPDLDGAQVYDRWLRDRPGLAEHTVILSGDLSRLDGAGPVPRHRILTKPVELADLRRALLAVGQQV